MSNMIVSLIEHYKNICIQAIVRKDKQNIEKYLSILLVLHKPTYLVLKDLKNKKSK